MNVCLRVHALAFLVAMSTLPAQEWRDLSPGVREGFACCYDPMRGVTVLFGGMAMSSATVTGLRDTWEWNGTQWTRIPTPVAPSGRLGSVMAYDPVRGTCLLFGGWASAFLTDTWEWNGVRWRQLQPTNSPPNFGETVGLATDFVRGRVVLSPRENGRTWEWDGTDWRVVPTTGVHPFQAPMTWDPVRRRVAAFSGNTHWEWDGATWTQASVAMP